MEKSLFDELAESENVVITVGKMQAKIRRITAAELARCGVSASMLSAVPRAALLESIQAERPTSTEDLIAAKGRMIGSVLQEINVEALAVSQVECETIAACLGVQAIRRVGEEEWVPVTLVDGPTDRAKNHLSMAALGASISDIGEAVLELSAAGALEVPLLRAFRVEPV